MVDNKLHSSLLLEGFPSIDTVNVIGVSFVGDSAVQRASCAVRCDRLGTAANALCGRKHIDFVFRLAGQRAVGLGSFSAIVLDFLVIDGCGGGLFLDLAHEGIGLRGELAACADSRAILVEEEGERHTGESKEGGDAGCPVDTEILVHVGGEEREGGTEEGSDDGVGSQNGSGEDGVGVDKVVHDAEEYQNHSESERDTGCDADHEVDRSVVGPSEPEKSNWDSNRCNETRWETGLGGSKAVMCFGGFDIALVVPEGVSDGNQHTNHDSQEGKTADTLVPATGLLVDDRESSEHHVQGTVNDSHVKGQQEDNRLTEQKDPRAGKRDLERVLERNLALVDFDLAPVDLARQLGKLLSTATEKHRGIGLGNHQRANDPDSTRESREEAHNPLPATVAHTNESTGDWTNDRAQERRSGEQTHSDTALLGGEHIGDDTTGIGQRRRSKGTGEESENDEGPGILGACDTGVESRESGVGNNE